MTRDSGNGIGGSSNGDQLLKRTACADAVNSVCRILSCALISVGLACLWRGDVAALARADRTVVKCKSVVARALFVSGADGSNLAAIRLGTPKSGFQCAMDFGFTGERSLVTLGVEQRGTPSIRLAAPRGETRIYSTANSHAAGLFLERGSMDQVTLLAFANGTNAVRCENRARVRRLGFEVGDGASLLALFGKTGTRRLVLSASTSGGVAFLHQDGGVLRSVMASTSKEDALSFFDGKQRAQLEVRHSVAAGAMIRLTDPDTALQQTIR